MSVLMTLRVRGDAKKLEEMAGQSDSPFPSISADAAKNYGAISHRFYATDEEVLVVDEWPDPESFQKFFEAHPEIQGIMDKAGVTARPEITFWRRLDLGDEIG